jgi:hypothetical protein
MLELPLSMNHREEAKLLQAEGWFSLKTTVYYIAIPDRFALRSFVGRRREKPREPLSDPFSMKVDELRQSLAKDDSSGQRQILLCSRCCQPPAGNSIFITSPLDLNDPFEMRPAWTDEHELDRYDVDSF